MGPIGVQEMIIIFLVALVLFGPRKLPELGKTIAKAMGEFKRAQSDLKATFDREMQAIERENESLKEATQSIQKDLYANFTDVDLVGGPSGTYGSQASGNSESIAEATALSDAISQSSTLSASEVTGAEAHVGLNQETAPSQNPELYRAAETGTIARGAKISEDDGEALPAFGHEASKEEKPSSELPSLA